MNQKYLAIAAIVFIAWFSWFYRYDLDSHSVVLDRWTGSVITGGHRYDLSDSKQPETKEDCDSFTTFGAQFDCSERARKAREGADKSILESTIKAVKRMFE